jgi:hypothetical protein
LRVPFRPSVRSRVVPDQDVQELNLTRFIGIKVAVLAADGSFGSTPACRCLEHATRGVSLGKQRASMRRGTKRFSRYAMLARES